jgi:hypothetical protein
VVVVINGEKAIGEDPETVFGYPEAGIQDPMVIIGDAAIGDKANQCKCSANGPLIISVVFLFKNFISQYFCHFVRSFVAITGNVRSNDHIGLFK